MIIEHPLDKLDNPLTMEMFSLTIKKLFGERFFSICKAEEAIKLINPLGEEVLRSIQPIHCVHWVEMSPQMAEHILETIAKAMVYSPILVSMGELDSEVDEAKDILRDILRPRRKTVRAEKSPFFEHFQEPVYTQPQKKPLLQLIFNRGKN